MYEEDWEESKVHSEDDLERCSHSSAEVRISSDGGVIEADFHNRKLLQTEASCRLTDGEDDNPTFL